MKIAERLKYSIEPLENECVRLTGHLAIDVKTIYPTGHPYGHNIAKKIAEKEIERELSRVLFSEEIKLLREIVRELTGTPFSSAKHKAQDVLNALSPNLAIEGLEFVKSNDTKHALFFGRQSGKGLSAYADAAKFSTLIPDEISEDGKGGEDA